MGYRIGRKPDTWLVPDVSISHPDQPGDEFYEGAPALAGEVVSESNRDAQIERKRSVCFAHGAEEVWVIEPETERVSVHRADGSQEFTGELRSGILPGLRIDLHEIFAAS